jgi:hypothetical protein
VTNTLHRRGEEDDLRRDFVLFCLPTRSITPELPEKLRRFKEIALRYKPVNANRLEGFSLKAIDPRRIDEELEHGFCLHAVYDDVEAVAGAVRDLVEADLGLPINISGPLEDVQSCCRRAGITRHSVEQSLGTRGRVERLPRPETIELNSLCGHGLVGFNLIEAAVGHVRSARMSVGEAALLLARPCQCGCFNPTRAAQILERVRTGG